MLHSNNKQIKNLIEKFSSGKSTAIDQSLLNQCKNYANSSAGLHSLFEELFKSIDFYASHLLRVYKCLLLIQELVNLRVPEITKILHDYAPDLKTITMLTFENKSFSTRQATHRMALSLYEYAIKNDTSAEYISKDNLKSNFVRKTVTESQPSIQAAAFDFNWEDNSDVDTQSSIEIPTPRSEKATEDDTFDPFSNLSNQNSLPTPTFVSSCKPTPASESIIKAVPIERDESVDPFDDIIPFDPFERISIPASFSLNCMVSPEP